MGHTTRMPSLLLQDVTGEDGLKARGRSVAGFPALTSLSVLCVILAAGGHAMEEEQSPSTALEQC